MRDAEFRRIFRGAALAAAITVAGAAVPSVAMAQVGGDPNAAQTTTTDNNNDDGTDWGWIGLLGLAGLLGLRKRDTHVHHTDTTTRRP